MEMRELKEENKKTTEREREGKRMKKKLEMKEPKEENKKRGKGETREGRNWR